MKPATKVFMRYRDTGEPAGWFVYAPKVNTGRRPPRPRTVPKPVSFEEIAKYNPELAKKLEAEVARTGEKE